jgi:cell division protein FtsB
MTKNQNLLLSIVILFLIAFFFYIIVSEHGLLDLRSLKQQKAELVRENRRLKQENIAISIEIDRLRHDPAYIESIARHELGMIGENEIILKPANQSERGK